MFILPSDRLSPHTRRLRACVRACPHSALGVYHSAPLPCVSAARRWWEEISETMVWTAAAPQTAADKSRPWALPADDHSILPGGGPHMLSRADSSKFSLPRTPFIPELQWKLELTLLTSDILGISSLRGVSWKWRQRGAVGGGRAMSS